MAPDLMELWLREFDACEPTCTGNNIDPEVIRAAAGEAFPAMNSFSQCLLSRFAAMCKKNG